MPLPLAEITREHIEAAILSLDEGVDHHFGASVTYDVVHEGKRYPPKAVVGLAAKLAVGREFFPKDFSGGEGSRDTNPLLRRLGFEVVNKRGGLSLTPEDFDVLVRNQHAVNWKTLSDSDRTSLTSLRRRIKEHIEAVGNHFRQGPSKVELKSFTSAQNPNGRNATYMWACLYASEARHKSYSFQLGFIVKPTHVEIGFFLGSGTDQTADVEKKLARRAALEAAQGRLASLKHRSVIKELEFSLGLDKRYNYNREYLGDSTTEDLENIADWIDLASGAEGPKAGISLFLSSDEVANFGDGFLDYLIDRLQIFYDLMDALYSPKDATTETVVISGSPLTLEWLSQKTLWPVESLQEVCDSLKDTSPQIVLAGPPGTGKTWLAKHLARFLTQDRSGSIRTVQFHPSYSYEEFVEGLRPVSEGGVLKFKIVDGVVKKFAKDMREDAHCRVLVIDEMNRANLARVFGELMYLFEYRDESIALQYSTEFALPKRLLFVGTMNTADRSIRSIDIALRRRFDVFPCEPDAGILERYFSTRENSVPNLISGFKQLNEELTEQIDRHHTIGHTFFMRDSFTHEHLRRIWKRKLGPLIEEYFFDQPDLAGQFTCERFWPEQ